MLNGVSQQLRRCAHDTGYVAAGVDGDIPHAPVQRRQVAVTVTAQMFRLGEQPHALRAPVEEGDAMALRQCASGQMPPQKLRAAENQYAHGSCPFTSLKQARAGDAVGHHRGMNAAANPARTVSAYLGEGTERRGVAAGLQPAARLTLPQYWHAHSGSPPW